MKIGIKSGCFTLLHSGHVWCLEEAAKRCDYLIVLTNADEYILEKKGNLPIKLVDRMYILKRLKDVDEVDWFPESTEDRWIREFKEQRLYQEFGNDAQLIVFHSDELKGREWVPAQDVADEIHFIDKVDRPESVSSIYRDIKEKAK